ncbi:unnamed protein product, partial [Prorocentrum cordatum]
AAQPDFQEEQQEVESGESDSCSTVDSEDFAYPRGAGGGQPRVDEALDEVVAAASADAVTAPAAPFEPVPELRQGEITDAAQAQADALRADPADAAPQAAPPEAASPRRSAMQKAQIVFFNNKKKQKAQIVRPVTDIRAADAAVRLLAQSLSRMESMPSCMEKAGPCSSL